MRDPGLFYPRGPSNQDQTHFYAYKGLEGRFQKKKKRSLQPAQTILINPALDSYLQRPP